MKNCPCLRAGTVIFLAFSDGISYNNQNYKGVAWVRITEKFVIRRIADETVAIPVGSVKGGFSGIISLNEVGEFLFAQLAEEQTEESLISALLAEYDVSRETAQTDVREFLDHLSQAGLLMER
jgi:hypothetical protein